MIDISDEGSRVASTQSEVGVMRRRGKKSRATSPETREIQRLAKFLLRDMTPELLAVKMKVTVYTVYRWSKGTTAAHQRHLEGLRKLVAAAHARRGRARLRVSVQ